TADLAASRYLRPVTRPSDRADCRVATKSPWASRFHSAWSEAARSGTQDLNLSGLTPITLARLPATVICAPSNVMIFRTPVIARRRRAPGRVRRRGIRTGGPGSTFRWRAPVRLTGWAGAGEGADPAASAGTTVE